MIDPIFNNISKIIERDSKTTTYKFALLRGVIDIIQDNSPYLRFTIDRVHIPTGLLIEKWLIYYYPVLESEILIPQINGEARLAFGGQLQEFIGKYKSLGGFSAFYNDLRNRGIPPFLETEFKSLARKIYQTITRMPMKHAGYSIYNEHYPVFKYEAGRTEIRTNRIDIEYLINSFGEFSIPLEYFSAFKTFGSFITGQDSLLFKWAEFSVNASGGNLSIERVINEVLKNPVTEREVLDAKKIYGSVLKNEGKVYCVWTGNLITRYDVDHMIPFSIWKNNDLWNLLPSRPDTNKKKKDKIPAVDLIEKQKDLITHYWNLLYDRQPDRFTKEIRVSLMGEYFEDNWQSLAIKQLKTSCQYLISDRGFEEWNI